MTVVQTRLDLDNRETESIFCEAYKAVDDLTAGVTRGDGAPAPHTTPGEVRP